MTILGWDMSHYDAIPAGGGARVAGDGFSFVTHKAGGDSNDAEIGAWWSAFRSFRDRLLLGAYWVLYPGNPAGRADAFLARLDATCPGWRDGSFMLQVDCEIWRQDPSTKPGKTDIKAFCDRLHARMPKLRPIVYASAGQYGDSLAGLGYPLWNARYPLSGMAGTAIGLYARCGGDAGKGWGGYSGQVPAIWQFSSSATIAGQTTCDANAYRGTLAQLTALVAPGWEEDMPTADEVADAVVEKLFAVSTQTDGSNTPVTTAGQRIWNQGVPDGTDGQKHMAWQVLRNLGVAVKAVAAQVGVSAEQLAAAIGQVDDQVLASLADAGRSDDEVAAALRAALGDRAAAVGRLLAAA